MDLELAGQTAVVVGAARGIGRAIVEAFVRERVQVVAVDVAREVQQMAEEFERSSPGAVRAQIADATDYAAMRQTLAGTIERLGRCDHLVYAAGAGSGRYGFPFWNLEPADWERVVRINLLGAVNAVHAAAPHLVEARRGTILLLSSVAGQIGSQTDPPYSAAKAALINFAQCAAKDLAPYNVRVNTICPGMVKTDLNRSVWQAWHDQQPPAGRMSYDVWAADKISRVTPLGRWQEPDDIAHMAVFLASCRAGNITGQTVNVDGGQVMHW